MTRLEDAIELLEQAKKLIEIESKPKIILLSDNVTDEDIEHIAKSLKESDTAYICVKDSDTIKAKAESEGRALTEAEEKAINNHDLKPGFYWAKLRKDHTSDYNKMTIIEVDEFGYWYTFGWGLKLFKEHFKIIERVEDPKQ